jgi:tetratricopeptide (TPR) repeat protein
VKNEGATSLNTIQLNKDCDEILFFSDAINTIGTASIKLPDVPVYMITSSPGSNYSFMKQVAQNTNGEFINLGSISQERAIQLMRSDEEKYLSCSYDSSEISEVYPNTSRQTGKYFEIAGILKDSAADLTVNFGNLDGITQSKFFNIGEGIRAPVERIWAGKKIESLSMDPERNKNQILDLSKLFTIITKNTALVVLDRIEDYVQYEIVPPEEMKKEYFALLANKKKVVQSDTVSVQKINSERSKKLFAWYENPILTIQSANTTDTIYEEEEAMYEVYDQESVETVPVTRQEERPVPPPPPESDAVFYIADNEMEMEDAAFEENMDMKSHHQSSIKVLGWLPDAPYMEELRNATNNEIEAKYYRFKKLNRNRPSFYIQVSDLYFERGMKKEAVRILSNILEMDLENPELLKIVARRLLEEGETGMAIEVFKEVKTLRPEEPQSFRDLALAYLSAGRYQDALDMYAIILNYKWDRFENIKDVVINEMNSLVKLHGDQLVLKKIDSGLIKAMPLDIRIVVDWSTNDNDIDLWVIDPNGEKCFYKHQYTALGGKLSKDFTRGYGPEEFSLRDANRGIYTVYVNYYGDNRQQIAGPVTVYAKLYAHYGTPEQSEKSLTIQLKDNKETRQVGQLEFYNE